MLSRFSSLFVYVVAGLAISAAATPGYQPKPKAAPYGNSPSYPPAPQQYPPSPQPYQPAPQPYQPPQGSYPPAGGSYGNDYQCNVGEQQCCDSTNYVSYLLCDAHLRWLITDTLLQLKDSDTSVTTGFLGPIIGSLAGDTLIGRNCSPFLSLQSNCKAEPMCCNHNYNVRLCLFSSFFIYRHFVCHQNGLIVVDCTKLPLII
jgi:hypothetical protein